MCKTLVVWFTLSLPFSIPIAGYAQNIGVVTGAGAVFVNGGLLNTPSGPALSGDVIQTGSNGNANVAFTGSSANLEPNSIVRVQNPGLSLDRGSLSVASGKQMTVFARDLKITPTSSAWTQFQVIRAAGLIQILARKNDVTVSCGTGRPTTVKEGQQISRFDSVDCGLTARKGSGAVPAASGPILNSKYAAEGVAAAGAGLALWSTFQPDDPASPAAP